MHSMDGQRQKEQTDNKIKNSLVNKKNINIHKWSMTQEDDWFRILKYCLKFITD